MLTTVLHELAHVCVAFALGVRSTLYNYSGDLDLTEAQAATALPALIRVAGPAFCLAIGTLSALGSRRMPGSAAELPLLYLAVFGLGTFFGNMMSIAFVGDFSAIAVAMHLPIALRYLLAGAGALVLATIHVWAGRRLVQFVPAQHGRVVGMLGIVALPVVLGMATVILVNQPMPGASVSARVAEASFWVFAAIGALATARSGPDRHEGLALHWVDGAVLLLVILVVRLMVRGIPFVPGT